LRIAVGIRGAEPECLCTERRLGWRSRSPAAQACEQGTLAKTEPAAALDVAVILAGPEMVGGIVAIPPHGCKTLRQQSRETTP
jgi:hypothetical protein